MTAPTLVGDIMSTVLVTIGPEDNLSLALDRMNEHNIHRLPVVKEDRGEAVLVGIISDRDLRLAANSPWLAEDPDAIAEGLHKLKVEDVLTESPRAVDRKTPAATAARIMLDMHVGGLPVVEWEGDHQYLVGVVTRSDLLALVIELEGERVGEG